MDGLDHGRSDGPADEFTEGGVGRWTIGQSACLENDTGEEVTERNKAQDTVCSYVLCTCCILDCAAF